MAGRAAGLVNKLHGLFAVYKPGGVHWKLTRDAVETNLLTGVRALITTNIIHHYCQLSLNSSPPATQRAMVQFQLLPSRDSSDCTDLTLTASALPSLADHPLVTGPQFHKVRVGVGHRLDAFSSGVLVLGVGSGNAALESLYRSHATRDYILEGEFGMATADFTHLGQVIERSTYDHVTQDKLQSVLAMIQGANQKALIMYSQVDLSTQEAYELAVKGMLRPLDKSPPIITGMRCLHFKPPHFTLEVQCVNETQRYLRKLLHEVGLELRTTAICTKVRRTRDGPFKMEDALTHQHWTADDIIPALTHFRRTTRKIRKNDLYRQAVKQMNREEQGQSRVTNAHVEPVSQEKTESQNISTELSNDNKQCC